MPFSREFHSILTLMDFIFSDSDSNASRLGLDFGLNLDGLGLGSGRLNWIISNKFRQIISSYKQAYILVQIPKSRVHKRQHTLSDVNWWYFHLLKAQAACWYSRSDQLHSSAELNKLTVSSIESCCTGRGFNTDCESSEPFKTFVRLNQVYFRSPDC